MKRLLAVAVLVLVAHGDAQAYIDPTSGSYFLQLLLAGILGAAFTLKMTWSRLKAFIASRFKPIKK